MRQIDFVQRLLADARIDARHVGMDSDAPEFLIVRGEMLDGRDDSFRLHAANFRHRDLADEKRVFTESLRGAPAVPGANQVERRPEISSEPLAAELHAECAAEARAQVAIPR